MIASETAEYKYLTRIASESRSKFPTACEWTEHFLRNGENHRDLQMPVNSFDATS